MVSFCLQILSVFAVCAVVAESSHFKIVSNLANDFVIDQLSQTPGSGLQMKYSTGIPASSQVWKWSDDSNNSQLVGDSGLCIGKNL